MQWSHPYSREFYLAVGLGLAGLLVIAHRFAKAPSARGAVLGILRAAALAVLVGILLNPVEVSETRRPGPRPGAIVLYDTSRSMGLESPSRISRAQALIDQAERRIDPDRRPRIDRYRFGRELSALTAAETPTPIDDETRLRSALERLPSRFGAALPTGVVVVSDGRSTEPGPLAAVARGYKALGVPIHVVPVGDPRVSGDVAVQDVIAPRDAPPGTKVPVRIVVRSRGYDGRRAELRIVSAADPQKPPVATLPITLAEGEQSHELVVESDRASGPLVAEIPGLDHEAIAENNRVPFQVTPRKAKIRVIYMEGTVGGGQQAAEYRWIRDALVEDPDIECVAVEVDNQNNASPRLHRVDDPSRGYPATREELFTYDVVICSDISRTAFTDEQIEWTAELVGRRGGGFVMIGGHTSFGSGMWDQTAWDGMIPVDMTGHGQNMAEAFHDGEFRVVVPPTAESHPVWRIVDDPARNREILARMPPFYGTNLTDRLKPAAQALGLSDRPLVGNAPMPVFSAQSFGKGRSFGMATDSTYAWGRDFERQWGEGDNRYFRKFWRNVVRWLAENSSGSSRRLRAETDKVVYRPGQPIRVTARAYDSKLEETDRYRIVATLGPPAAKGRPSPPAGRPTGLSPRIDDKIYQGELPAPSAREALADPGSTVQRLALEVVAYDGPEVAARSTLEVQVLDDPAEFQDPRPDPSRLEALAQATGGQVLRDPSQLSALLGLQAQAPDRVTVSRSPLWDTPLVWILLLGLLSTEWIVRRLKGLA